MTAGTAQYTLPADTIDLLDQVIRTGDSGSGGQYGDGGSTQSDLHKSYW